MCWRFLTFRWITCVNFYRLACESPAFAAHPAEHPCALGRGQALYKLSPTALMVRSMLHCGRWLLRALLTVSDCRS